MSVILENQDNINNIANQNIFYRAVVENNDDGGRHGACQVRILGIHPVNAQRSSSNLGVLTEDLPWAELMVSTSYHGGMSGYGVSSVPLKGSWVWIFLDGGDWNRPIIVGLISGTSNEERPDGPKSEWGFHDPDKIYPNKDRLGEPDQNRLMSARNFDKTLIKTVKDKKRDTGIPTVTGKTWDELQEKSSQAVYPNNRVVETISGNYIEMDETDNSGRMHWFHHSGTYWEVIKDGDYTMKVTKDKYEIIDRDSKRLNKRDEFHTIQRDSEYKIDRDRFIFVGRHSEETVNKSVTQNYNDTLDTTVNKSVTQNYNNTLEINVKSTSKESYQGGQEVDAGPSMTLKAGVIKLN